MSSCSGERWSVTCFAALVRRLAYASLPTAVTR